MRDVVMVGAGPAALTAAIYTTRESIDTIAYEKGNIGGLAATTDWIDNYPGYAEGVAGMKLATELQAQAERFGAEVDYGEVSGIEQKGDHLVVTVDGKPVETKTVLIATGSEYKKLGVPGEAEYYSRGVHYCATCDGAFYKDRRVAIIGGGNSGVQEALFMTRYATHIDLIVRSELRASEVLLKRLKEASDQITVYTNVTTEEILAKDDKVTGVRIKEKKTGDEQVIDTEGVFVFIGLVPNSQFLEGSDVKLDDQGMVVADESLQTTMPGVFVAGDVRSGATAQIASAVGEGARAALAIREYLESKK